jgi:hypothetical protein
MVAHKTKLDKAADAILNVMERHAESLPALERDAKWRAFGREVAKIGTPAGVEIDCLNPAAYLVMGDGVDI